MHENETGTVIVDTDEGSSRESTVASDSLSPWLRENPIVVAS